MDEPLDKREREEIGLREPHGVIRVPAEGAAAAGGRAVVDHVLTPVALDAAVAVERQGAAVGGDVAQDGVARMTYGVRQK